MTQKPLILLHQTIHSIGRHVERLKASLESLDRITLNHTIQ